MDDHDTTYTGTYIAENHTMQSKEGETLIFRERTVTMTQEQKLEMRILELEARLDDIRDCVEQMRKFLP